MRAIFLGTPEFAVPALAALEEVCQLTNGAVVGVVCQPDRPAGRGLHLRDPPVKLIAQSRGFDLLQPTKVRDGTLAAWIRARDPDVCLVIAYGRILPRDVLDAPRAGCMNLHASILPRHRGAAPIAWAIAKGDRETGITLMRMDEGLDTGPVLAELRTPIDPDETTGALTTRLSVLAAELVRTTLIEAVQGRITARPQNDAEATLAPLLRKEDGLIDWTQRARTLHDHVRAMQPWPSSFTMLPDARAGGNASGEIEMKRPNSGKTIKIVRTRLLAARVMSGANVRPLPGTLLLADRGGVVAACGPDGEEAILLCRGQLEGKRVVDFPELVNGRVLAVGTRLGTW